MLNDILNLSPDQKAKLEADIGPVRSLSDFFSNILEATKELPLKEALSSVIPWAVKGGTLISEVTPVTKAVVKIVDEIAKEKDPEVLGLVACTLAYQHAAALALAQQGQPADRVPFEQSLASARQAVKNLRFQGSLTGFTLEAPLAHPFVWAADEAFRVVVRNSGYSESEWRSIQSHTHAQFNTDLVEVLSHGESASRFEPFTRSLTLGDSSAAFSALNAHIERQRWAFENRPVLNIEPFTLRDVYVDTDCGELLWKDFPASGGRRDPATARFDAFSEEFGGRQPLLDTVLGYLRDPSFNDAIVIQGAPGSGKSSFTLRLANVLRREGLLPIRIRLKFLDLKRNLSEALGRVILQPEEGEDPSLSRLPPCSDPLLGDSIFQERTNFGDGEICPYVLILDGWDEISVAVNEGFEIEVHRMLRNIRDQFLRPRPVKVRVVLTGRPSNAVERSQFLRDDTPILTVREYTGEQLQLYAAQLRQALEGSDSKKQSWAAEINWNNISLAVASFRRNSASLEILGLPLLAHLSFRLLAEWQGESIGLLADRTTLYRHLLDLTCLKAGKAASDSDDLQWQARVRGDELRRMLQQTAVAITTYGNESIPFRELQLRLRKTRKQAMQDAESASKDTPLTNLMISFYFKGGREHLGCEFLHKSFREYLYAEAVVEVLKDYGRKQSGPLPKRHTYWRDFDEGDARRQLSRELSQLLGPYPLVQEIRSQVYGLLKWEIGRSNDISLEGKVKQAALSSSEWEAVRDSLADVWEWWGEGVHLRPQPYRDNSDNLGYRPALVNEFLDQALPRDRGPDAVDWWPGRLINMDSNIGEAVCQLTAWVHQLILHGLGWEGTKISRAERLGEGRFLYQTKYMASGRCYTLFRPTGSASVYFRNYCSRINAAGNLPNGFFPSGVDLSCVDLSETNLMNCDMSRATLYAADLRDAMLGGASLDQTKFSGADLSNAVLFQADLMSADLTECNLTGAVLIGVDLTDAALGGVIGLADEQLASALRRPENKPGSGDEETGGPSNL